MKSFGNRCTKLLICVVAVAFLLALFLPFSGNIAYADGEKTEVYLGGIPIGINAKSSELVVSELVNVTTANGSYSPAYQSGIQKGDIICLINNRRVTTAEEFNSAVGSGDTVVITVKRGNKLTDITVKPEFDLIQQSKKVGMLLKDEISGIGTLTFVNMQGGYGALGHMITDGFGYGSIYSVGNIYNCCVTGYSPATEEKPGELRGKIDYRMPTGTLTSNKFCGIYGKFLQIPNDLQTIEVAPRSAVKNGKAQIYTTINGTTPKLYDIEIIKAIKQNEPADKSMVIRVTDKELKKTTGGILQGMSGSPIIQDGKLIGAVTHVFTSDSTKGYGIYIDWMLDNAN